MSVADGDDDEAFLIALEQAEAAALDSAKRRRLSSTSSSSTPSTPPPPATPEGPYLAALKGSHSSTWKQQAQDLGYAHKQPYGSKPLAAGSGGGGAQVPSGACFKCGDPGHWARDCPQSVPNAGGGGQIGGGGGAGGGVYVNVELKVEDKPCPCGAGTCLVLTSNTLKNPGRRFYKCPMRDGGCNFFEWCDAPSPAPANARNNMAAHSETSATDMLCPCGAGTCLILTAKTGKNVGRQFFRCPLNQGGGSCGFFKWCDEQQPRVGAPLQASPQYQADSMSSIQNPNLRSSSSCFKCGQDNHWARDCPNQSSDAYPDKGGRPITSGSSAQYKADSMSSIQNPIQRSSSSCFKCGQDDHWARDCPNQSSDPYPDKGGRPLSSPGACYNCGRAGHWSRDCPTSNSGGGSGGTGSTSRAKSSSALSSWNSQRY